MFGQTNKIITVFLIVVVLALSGCSSGGSVAGSPTAPAVLDGASTPAGAAPTPFQPPAAQTTATSPSASQPTASQPTATLPAATLPPIPQPAAAASPTAAQTQTAAVPATGNQNKVPTDTVTAFPNPANYTWTPVVSGVPRLTGMASLPDGSGRMFLIEQDGTIRVAQNGNLLPNPLLDITSRVGSQGSEQGLLGIALHPNFTQNGYFYVNYTDVNGNTVIARFQVSKQDPNRADPNSEKILLHVDQPFPNHNGGSMVFGPDGYLYMGLGDGGSEGDPQHNGQSTNTLLGKLLRIDVNSGDPYGIPADNPFVKGGGKPEIWAHGLRNPWRFSFDRLTGDLYIGDVGQNLWEEIDYLPAGSPGGTNFGWSYREGMHRYRGTPPAGLKLADPVFEYSHSYGCAVTGGYVYRGAALPEFHGIYLFGDYCSGRVWGLLKGANGSWQSQELFDTGSNPSSFGEDTNGEVYLLDQGGGSVLQLRKK